MNNEILDKKEHKKTRYHKCRYWNRYSTYCVGYYATLRLISNMGMGLNADSLMRSGWRG